MPRTAAARRDPADEAATTRVDELIRLGRGQGHLSLAELRAAFAEAGMSASEGRSIIRELAEAGVRLGNEPAGGGDAAQERARTARRTWTLHCSPNRVALPRSPGRTARARPRWRLRPWPWPS